MPIADSTEVARQKVGSICVSCFSCEKVDCDSQTWGRRECEVGGHIVSEVRKQREMNPGLNWLCPFYQSKVLPNWDSATHILGFIFQICWKEHLHEGPELCFLGDFQSYRVDNQD